MSALNSVLMFMILFRRNRSRTHTHPHYLFDNSRELVVHIFYYFSIQRWSLEFLILEGFPPLCFQTNGDCEFCIQKNWTNPSDVEKSFSYKIDSIAFLKLDEAIKFFKCVINYKLKDNKEYEALSMNYNRNVWMNSIELLLSIKALSHKSSIIELIECFKAGK